MCEKGPHVSPYVVPVPNTELVVEGQTSATVIGHHLGVCKAVELNETGYQIWRLIDGSRSVADISVSLVCLLSPSTRPSDEAILADVQDFVTELVRHGLVEMRVIG